MFTLNDLILAAVPGNDSNAGLVAHFQANGATSSDLQTAEYEFLVASGATPADHVQDMWLELLPAAVGFSADLQDMLYPFWGAGGTFAPPAAPSFDGTGWPTSFETTEEAAFTFDCKPFWSGGGYISIWQLSGDVPSWMSIGQDGVIRGTPPFGDRNYTGIVVSGNNATGPAATSPSTPVNTPANVAITVQPISQMANEGDKITLNVGATDATGYQWYRNSILIPGATSMSYTTPVLDGDDDGDEYYCVVEGAGGVQRTSNTATLTVVVLFNNLLDGSGLVVQQITLAAGQYTLSVSGSGWVEISEVTASIIGIG